MNDDQLIGYCEIHCKTERALFNADQINRMITLAGLGDHNKVRAGWYAMHDEMQELVDMAKAAMKEQPAEPQIDGYPLWSGLPSPVERVALSDDLIDAVSKALRRSWQLGQTYWQQADSESYSQHKRADETHRKFDQLIEETRALLTSQADHMEDKLGMVMQSTDAERRIANIGTLRPILYTDEINGIQTCQDDLWLVTTKQLESIAATPHHPAQPLIAEAARVSWLSYVDIECTEKQDKGLHTVSGFVAGQAYNDLCKMIGERWPDCKLESKAPVAHKFFMGLFGAAPAIAEAARDDEYELTPEHALYLANSPEIDFIDMAKASLSNKSAPTFNQAEFDSLVEKGTKAWAGVAVKRDDVAGDAERLSAMLSLLPLDYFCAAFNVSPPPEADTNDFSVWAKSVIDTYIAASTKENQS